MTALVVLLALAAVTGLLVLVARQRYAGKPALRTRARRRWRAVARPGTLVVSSAALRRKREQRTGARAISAHWLA